MMTTLSLPTSLAELDKADALARVSHYFGTCACALDTFTGASFETIGHVWNKKSKVNTISPGDLLALSTLSVPVSGESAIWLLEPGNLRKAQKLLRKIPVDLTITDPKAKAAFAENGSATKLWHHWRQAPGMGPVSTSKLLARKRGNLIPVYDSVIKEELAIEHPGQQWDIMRKLLAKDRHNLWVQAATLRKHARLHKSVTPLRVLDVVMWHRGRYPNWTPCTASAE